jgi:hypothetical protein
VDPKCKLIYSIDRRPPRQWDERGQFYYYEENSTARMMMMLHSAHPQVTPKVVPFEGDAWECDPQLVHHAPHIAFIDGEHTVNAAYRDFRFCQKVLAPKGSVICFHDSGIVFNGINKSRRFLMDAGISHLAMMLTGNVYCILLGGSCALAGDLESVRQDETTYFEQQFSTLNEHRAKVGHEPIEYRLPEDFDPEELEVEPPKRG